ncbi:MAG: YggS family pyridoxal phosphate-dependent enzyme, partial [Candidatus Nanopelagicales bacterium]
SASCALAKRDKSEITLIAVTKNFPASDVEILHELGIEHVGENKDQEASAKHIQVKAELTWHFVGQLQRNKVKSVVKYCQYIHSVDRLSLAKEISKQAELNSRNLKIFIQVDLDESDVNRGGVGRADLAALAKEISLLPAIQIEGLMAVAPLGVDPSQAFSKLREIQADFLKDFPEAVNLSIGMSEDFEIAIAHGATHLRIGSLLLGVRPILR